MFKKVLAVLIAVMTVLALTVSASAYTLSGDFTPYTPRDMDDPELALPPNEPVPEETADGIKVLSDKGGSGIFTNTHTGVTLTKHAVDMDGFTVTFRVDRHDADAMYPGVMLCFTQNPGMFTWNVDMEGATLGNEGICWQYRFADPKNAGSQPYFEATVARFENAVKSVGTTQHFPSGADLGDMITLKIAEDDTYGYIVWVNGQVLRQKTGTNADASPIISETPMNFKGMRKIADKYEGKMYFSFSPQSQAIFGEQIGATLMFVNGEKVSSKQTNTEPTYDYETVKDGVILPPEGKDEPVTSTPSTESKPDATTSTPATESTPDETTSTEAPVQSEEAPVESTPADTTSSQAGGTASNTDSDPAGPNIGLIVAIVVVAVLVVGGGVAAFIVVKMKQ